MMAEEVARNVLQVLMRKCALNNYSHCVRVDTISSHISKELSSFVVSYSLGFQKGLWLWHTYDVVLTDTYSFFC